MNKELINKYKPEFDHWLNEGKILYKHTNSNAWWNEEPWSYSLSYVTAIIINDEYAEFRKALAEGKTIQTYYEFNQTWNDVINPPFKDQLKFYRIKPIKPIGLKLGDYVKLTSTTHSVLRTYPSWFQIDGKNVTLHTDYDVPYINIIKGCHIFCLNELELWQPKPNEWCWFWDKCTPHRPTLRQYDIFPEGYGEENMFHDSEQNPFDFCEPFLNSRPSHLKDK